MRDSKQPAGHILQAFHDGELASSVTSDVDAHCRQCADCRAVLADLERTDQLLTSVPMPELPRTVWPRVRPKLESEPRLRPTLGIAACAVSIVLGVLLGPVRFSAEEAGSDLAWSESVTIWNGSTIPSLLTVYQAGQE